MFKFAQLYLRPSQSDFPTEAICGRQWGSFCGTVNHSLFWHWLSLFLSAEYRTKESHVLLEVTDTNVHRYINLTKSTRQAPVKVLTLQSEKIPWWQIRTYAPDSWKELKIVNWYLDQMSRLVERSSQWVTFKTLMLVHLSRRYSTIQSWDTRKFLFNLRTLVCIWTTYRILEVWKVSWKDSASAKK